MNIRIFLLFTLSNFLVLAASSRQAVSFEKISLFRENILKRRILKVSKTLKSLISITGLYLLTAIPTGPAYADDFPSRHLADSSLHTYCFDAFEGDVWTGHYAMEILRSTTDMTIRAERCSNFADVIFRDRDIPGRIRGQYQCLTFFTGNFILPGSRCGSSEVVLDFAELDIGDLDWYDRRKTAVHEVGHSVGAGHDTVSAMSTGEIPGVDFRWRRFSAHDIDHINANY